MPPLTPSRMRATAPPGPLAPVAVVDLPAGELLEGDRQVVAGMGLDHWRRELLVAALAERPVVAVELARPLRRDDDGGVVRVGVLQQLVDAWPDHLPEDDR